MLNLSIWKQVGPRLHTREAACRRPATLLNHWLLNEVGETIVPCEKCVTALPPNGRLHRPPFPPDFLHGSLTHPRRVFLLGEPIGFGVSHGPEENIARLACSSVLRSEQVLLSWNARSRVAEGSVRVPIQTIFVARRAAHCCGKACCGC